MESVDGASAQKGPETDSSDGGGFDAFISYSHQDDAHTAQKLQKSIEFCLDHFFGSRSLRVFRDEANLPITEDLWDAIANSLDRSSYFLLLASPRSRSSPWVDKEVAHFTAKKEGKERFGIVLTQGKTPWTDPDYDPGAGDSAVSQTVINLLTKEGREPRVVDLRPFITPSGRIKTNRAYREKVAEIVARIKGLEKDIVLRTHLRELKRRIMIFLLLTVLATMAVTAAYSEFTRRRQAQEAEIEQRALKLSADSYQILYRRPLISLDRAYQALNTKPIEQAETALRDAHRVAVKRMFASEIENVFFSGKELFGFERKQDKNFLSRTSKDGRYELRALTEQDKKGGEVYLVDHESGYMRPVTWPQKNRDKANLSTFGFLSSRDQFFILKGYYLLTFDLDGAFLKQVEYANALSTKTSVHILMDVLGGRLMLAGTTSGAVWLFDPENQKREAIETRNSPRGALRRLVSSSSGRYVLLVFENETASLVLISSLNNFIKLELNDLGATDGVIFESESQCKLILTGRSGLCQEYDIKNGTAVEVQAYSHGEEDVLTAAFSEDGQRFITISDEATARVWQLGSSDPQVVLADRHDIDWKARYQNALEGEIVETGFRSKQSQRFVLFDDKLPGIDVKVVGGRQWLLTAPTMFDRQIYEIVDNNARHVLPKRESVHQIFAIGTDVWLATSFSVYQLRGDNILRFHLNEWIGGGRLLEPGVHLFPIKNQLWLGTEAGAYQIQGDRAILKTERALSIADIEEIGDSIWLVGNVKRGTHGPKVAVVMRGSGERIRKFKEIRAEGLDLAQVGDTTYLGTRSGVYRLDSQNVGRIPGSEQCWVSKILEFDSHAWFTVSNGPAYHVSPSRATPLPGPDSRVSKVLPANGKIWLVADGQAYVGEPDGSGFQPLPALGTSVQDVLYSGGVVWIATGKGAYRLDKKGVRRIPDQEIDVTSLKEINDAVWLVTADKAWRVINDVVTAFVPNSTKYPLQSVMAVSERIAGVTYDGYLTGPMVELIPGEPQ